MAFYKSDLKPETIKKVDRIYIISRKKTTNFFRCDVGMLHFR